MTARPFVCSVLLGGAVSMLFLAAPRFGNAQPAPQPSAGQSTAGETKPTAHFDINEFRVDGNTVLTEDEIDRAVYDYLGPDKTINDVEKARAALEAAYSAKGYPTVSTSIPVQHVANGVVVLAVTERPVGRLRVRGARYYDLGAIKEGAPALAPGKVPNVTDVQQQIVALNQWPDRTVTPALRAGVAPGTVDVDLNVQDRFPGHATLELNNRQSPDTTPLRLSGSLGYNNLWQRGDSATLTFQVAPQNPSDAEVISGSYLFRIPDSQLSLLASYLKSNSNVTTVGSTNVIGKGTISGLRLLVPLGFDEGFVHTLSTGMDYKHFDDTTQISLQSSETPVTYYPYTVSYQATWNGLDAQTNLIANIVFTFRGLGSSAAQFDQVRFDASPSFIYLRGDVARTQTLPHDMQLYGHLAFQLAPAPLISNEQFSLGGLDTVRGYQESEALGDYGGALQVELRSPSLSDFVTTGVIDDARLLAFFDGGSTAIHNPLPQQTSSYTLASAGFGVRLRLFSDFNGEVVGAWPITNGPFTKAGDGRVLFRIYGDF
jgi:hemolysin activation/secretion protein